MKSNLAFEKICLGDIEKCYAVLGLEVDGAPCLYYGGEGQGSLQVYRGENFEDCQVIWQGGGGTMSIVALPGRPGWALASRGFTSMVDCLGSTVEIIRLKEGVFSHAAIAHLPFLHRFDTLLAPDGTRYLFAATLHSGKADKADWSRPGHVFQGVLPQDVDEDFTVDLQPLPGDLYVNHGFCKGQWQGREAAFTASQEGVFAWLPPQARGGAWAREQLLDCPVSDIAVADVDADGQAEIAALMPFHGDQFKIFRLQDGQYREVYAYPVENDFYHAVISGRIGGETLFVGGARKLTADLFLIRWDDQAQAYIAQQLDVGQGPSNLALLNRQGEDLLLSANRMVFQAAAYRFPRA